MGSGETQVPKSGLCESCFRPPTILYSGHGGEEMPPEVEAVAVVVTEEYR